MNILVTGSTGLIGTALIEALTALDHRVTRLTRGSLQSREPVVQWNPATGTLNANEIEGFDAVVHLAGESIAARRWSAAQKARLRDSRVKGTTLLSETLAKLAKPPKVLVCASAIGYYGNRGDEILREDSKIGSGFLAEVCQQWENAAEPARRKGIRVVYLRNGLVLSPKGGALAKMLLPFKLGVGGIIGDGRQYWSWVSLDDVVGAFCHALMNESLHDAANLVAPRAVTNREFTKTLGKVLSRPTIFPLPAFAARLALGEMADELLLSSARIEPARLLASGYQFRHPELEGALRDLLGKK
ncbi:MAG: TIGR01777 family oxidoreductase [candidate division KSB1 bacterium]|nr:TIGR01777 family oxidoreductase [candidate division KSB1 bacterium]MDZ7366434.1 TIGR01777 family oxidoreductase [candidate division KSB1 bacterium]MDZ7404604.1 TIGR01777 family oxidoreductase [candidate division KSB1 bacterium]